MISVPVERIYARRLRFLRTPWFAGALIVCLGGLIYGGTFRVPFMFDDVPSILSNPTLKSLWRSWSPPTEYGATVSGRPFLNFSLAVNFALNGTDVWGYHLMNLMIHLAAGIILFDIVRCTLESSRLAPRFGSKAFELALAVSLLWIVHPLQTESITYIIQRAESLMGLMYLLTLWCFIRSIRVGGDKKWQWLAVCACFLGMATKEVMATAPLIVAFYDRIFVASSWREVWTKRRLLLCGLASSWLVLLALVLSTSGRGGTAGMGSAVSPIYYAMTQIGAVAHYIGLTVWPAPLVFDYGTPVVSDWKEIILPALLIIPLGLASLWAALRGRPIGFCGLFFFCVLAPSSSIVPVATQTIAEHRMYLPTASLVSAAVLGLYRWLGRPTLWLAATLTVALGASTVIRNRDYREVITIWADTVAKCPSNARAHNNFALELQKSGRTAEANHEFASAVKIDNHYVSAHSNWGAALLAQGKVKEAVEQLRIAVELAPAYADAHLNLGNALATLPQTSEAIAQYEQALALQPDAADVHFNLGLALDNAGQPETAAAHLRTALKTRPDLTEAYYRLARIADQAGNYEEAERDYEEVLRRAPENSAAEAGLGVLFARTGRMQNATEHLEKSLRIRPQDPDTLSNLGNVYLLIGRTREAIAHYEESLRLRPDDTGTRENLRIARETIANAGG